MNRSWNCCYGLHSFYSNTTGFCGELNPFIGLRTQKVTYLIVSIFFFTVFQISMIANIESIKNSSEFINNIRILLFYPFKADLTSEFKSQNDQIYCCDFKNRLTFNTKYFSGAAQFAIFQSKKDIWSFCTIWKLSKFTLRLPTQIGSKLQIHRLIKRISM